MWNLNDFETIEETYQEDAEEYSYPHPNQKIAQTLLISVQNLEDFHSQLTHTQGAAIEDEHGLQLFYLPRGIQELFSLYWLCKYHCYSASYSRVRFLWELYIVVREFNREKEKTKQKWKEFKKEMNSKSYGSYDTLPMTDYFGGKRRQLKGELASKEDLYGDIYNRISNLGSHPHSVKSSGNDGKWTQDQEKDVLQFGLIFAYALAVQYIRTFESSDIARFVHRKMDEIIVQIHLVFTHFPIFLEEDLDFLTLI